MDRIWDAYITELDRQVYGDSGLQGKRAGFGIKPAILVIDVQYRTVGEDKPILESVKTWPMSCGDRAWKAVRKLQTLLVAAREKKVPIIYPVLERTSDFDTGPWKDKVQGMTADINRAGHLGTKILDEIAPQPRDIVVSKRYASSFFGTPLMTYLNQLRVDTVIVTGCTTSGCVRATVIDAFSYALKVIVVENCVYDRGEASHAINLFDINSKYGDVMTMEEVWDKIMSLPTR